MLYALLSSVRLSPLCLLHLFFFGVLDLSHRLADKPNAVLLLAIFRLPFFALDESTFLALRISFIYGVGL
jgi:hypothetical protein